MAARLNPRNCETVRNRIKAEQLVDCLQKHALGKKSLKITQIRAAEVLLRKCVPDLAHSILTDGEGAPLNFTLSIPPKAK